MCVRVCVCVYSVCVRVWCVYVGTWLRGCILCAQYAVIMEEGVWLTSIVVSSTEQDIIYIYGISPTLHCAASYYIYTQLSQCV